ncbi:MAG TPA: amidohydrolase family protein [Gemmatimonadales bacterium]|nr:amidohydrolase family protein [Gemmatimonadales bacterium]
MRSSPAALRFLSSLWLTVAALAPPLAAQGHQNEGGALVIKAVSVVDVTAGLARNNLTVVVRGARIETVGDADAIVAPAGSRVIDGTGRFLLPGLWDVHAHTGGDGPTLQAMVASGVTGVRDMGGDIVPLAEARRRIAAGELPGPRLVIAGPLLRGPKSASDASDAESWVIRTPEEGRQSVRRLRSMGVDFVKVHEDLSREAFAAILAAARDESLYCVGHVPASLTPAEASDLGLRSIEHLEFLPDSCLALFAADPKVPRAAPPSECSAGSVAELLRRLDRNGTWLDPTIGSFRYWAPQQWNAIFVGFRGLVSAIRGSGIGLLAGTDWSTSLQSRGAPPPGASLHDELRLLVEAGFTPAETLRAAVSSPARFLGLSATLGAIEPAKTADLVVLAGDPLQDIRNTRRIAAVIHDGRVVHETSP